MNIIQKPLPHHSSRGDSKISAIILHYPAPNLLFEEPYSVEAVHDLLTKEKLSYHYYVTKQGEIYQFVQDKDKAWHAGVSNLHGVENCNLFSIGVCLENNGGEHYPAGQMSACMDLCRELAAKYKIPHNRIVGHCHVSPDRKVDPGPKFDWYDFFFGL